MKMCDARLRIYPRIPVYEGDSQVSVEGWLSITEGVPANVSTVAMDSHAGTHIDAPMHFRDGAMSVEQLALDVLIGPARVVLREMAADLEPCGSSRPGVHPM